MQVKDKQTWLKMDPIAKKQFKMTMIDAQGNAVIFEEDEKEAFDEALSQFKEAGNDRAAINWEKVSEKAKSGAHVVPDSDFVDEKLEESLQKLEDNSKSFNLHDVKRILNHLVKK